jgi:two-component system response regulator WspF
VQNAEKLVTRLAQLAAETSPTGYTSISLPALRSLTADLPPLVLLGASTGGPEALTRVVSALPENFPAAVLICQHIGADFAQGLIQQLAASTKLPVRNAKDGEAPTAGTIHVAVSNDHLALDANGLLRYTPEPRTHPYRPSIDVLFKSTAAHRALGGVAALLTGMGTDGADGLLRLRTAGWHTIAQDEATSTVYGMPKAAAEKSAAVEVLPLQHIGASIIAKVLARKGRV